MAGSGRLGLHAGLPLTSGPCSLRDEPTGGPAVRLVVAARGREQRGTVAGAGAGQKAGRGMEGQGQNGWRPGAGETPSRPAQQLPWRFTAGRPWGEGRHLSQDACPEGGRWRVLISCFGDE